jgi:hypothetical protein
VDEQMEKIIHFVEEMYIAPLMSREKEILALGDKLFQHELPRSQDGDGEEETEEEGEGLSPDELIASLNRAERSMAEAEGMGDWESRHEGREGSQGRESASKPARSNGGPLTLDEARNRARTLRNPRDWEKK